MFVIIFLEEPLFQRIPGYELLCMHAFLVSYNDCSRAGLASVACRFTPIFLVSYVCKCMHVHTLCDDFFNK
jgi:hypothetical protein